MSNVLKNKFAGSKFVKTHEPDKELEISVAHKALIQWETNVDKNKFPYDYIYNYPEETSYAVIVVKSPPKGSEVIIQFTYGNVLPYKFIIDGETIFVCDTLRDIINWFDKEPN